MGVDVQALSVNACNMAYHYTTTAYNPSLAQVVGREFAYGMAVATELHTIVYVDLPLCAYQ